VVNTSVFRQRKTSSIARGDDLRLRGAFVFTTETQRHRDTETHRGRTVRPRLGQRSFRIAVLDTYERRCAITDERTLPVLEAAHIRDYRDVQEHTLSNGVLFRADIHKLFDSGYVTVTPDYHFEVSRRIKEEFENGHDYYALHGSSIRLRAADRPAADALIWHNEQRYLG
jgi:putative restriction endonuclease